MKCFKKGIGFLLLILSISAYADHYVPGYLGDEPNKPAKEHHSSGTITIIPHYNMLKYDRTFSRFFRSRYVKRSTKVYQRIALASSFFLKLPYVLAPLGEGKGAKFDKEPLYRSNGYDCLTYVSTILAMVQSTSLDEFKSNIIKIRYHKNKVSFVDRNHFVSVDWNPVNERNGFIKDITTEISPHYKVAHTIIDKPNWFRNLTASNIRVFRWISAFRTTHVLNDLHKLADQVKIATSNMKYIPLSVLYHDIGGRPEPNKEVFDAIPNASIIEIVRADWDLKNVIGTNLNVSHVGFAIRKRKKGLAFREASSVNKKVIDVPLERYLKSYWNLGPDKVGIHVMKVISPRFES